MIISAFCLIIEGSQRTLIMGFKILVYDFLLHRNHVSPARRLVGFSSRKVSSIKNIGCENCKSVSWKFSESLQKVPKRSKFDDRVEGSLCIRYSEITAST